MSKEIEILGQKIRARRKAQCLTQLQQASVCGVGARFIRELEKGKYTCQLGKVLHVISMLGLEVRIE